MKKVNARVKENGETKGKAGVVPAGKRKTRKDEVATGKILSPSAGDTRTEEDFVAHIRATVETDPQGEWIFICDQLNTRQSAGLVRLVSQLCGLESDLGKKGVRGILQIYFQREVLGKKIVNIKSSQSRRYKEFYDHCS